MQEMNQVSITVPDLESLKELLKLINIVKNEQLEIIIEEGLKSNTELVKIIN